MEQLHFLIDTNGSVEMVKTKFFGATNTKPSRIKVTPTNLSLEDCGKSITVGCSGAETADCIRKAMPGFEVLSQGEVLSALEKRYKDVSYVASIYRVGAGKEENIYCGTNRDRAVWAIDNTEKPPHSIVWIESWAMGMRINRETIIL